MRKIDFSRLKTTEPIDNSIRSFITTSLSYANSTSAGVVQVVDSTSNSSATVVASANSVKVTYDLAASASGIAATAYSNAVSTSSTDASTKAATAYSNAVSQATSLASAAYTNAVSQATTLASAAYSNATSVASSDASTKAATAYSNAVAYAASNTYVNTQVALKADLAGATFTGAVAVSNTLAAGNTTITGFANVTGSLTVGGVTTIAGNLVVNGTTITVNTSQINTTDSLMYLASNNEVSDSIDIGFAAHYNNGAGANGHTGFIRSAVTKKYYLFQNYQPEFFANNTVDVSNTATGIQMADLVVGNLVANSTLSVTGGATFSNTIAVTGGATFSNTIAVTGTSSFTTVAVGSTAANVTANSSMVRVSANATLHASLGANGIMINGSYGTNSNVLKSTGTGSLWATISKYDVGLGNVQNVDQQNASNLTYGTVAAARLGTGTANSTYYLRGDGAWTQPALSDLANVAISTPTAGQPLAYTGTTVTIGGTYTPGSTPGFASATWNKNSNTVPVDSSNTEMWSVISVGAAVTLYWNAGANSVTTTVATVSNGYSFDVATANPTGAGLTLSSITLPTSNVTTYSWKNSNTLAVANVAAAGYVVAGNTSTATPIRYMTVYGGEVSIVGANTTTPVGLINVSDASGNLGANSSLIIRGLASNGSVPATLANVQISTTSLLVSGDIYSNYSDINLKTKLGDIEDALDIIDSIDTMYYEPNQLALDMGASPGRKVGVSAQSVLRRASEAVGRSPMNDMYLTVQYERLVPYLIESVKQLRKQIKELKGQ